MEKSLAFLRKLEKNNNREWFQQHKSEFEAIQKENKQFFEAVFHCLQEVDKISKMHIVKIYRDLRFAKEKIPYKDYLGASFARVKPMFRGGYYVHIEPNNSFVGGGFWSPNSEDLLRIRRGFERDVEEVEKIVSTPDFQRYFGGIQGENGVKTAPKGFDKNHQNIEIIKKKQFVLKRKFTDKEVCADDFGDEIFKTFLAVRPFFDYMTNILTTDANGELLF